MLHLTEKTPIILALQAVDFRKRIDGLAALCEQYLDEVPRSGQLFVFINRAKTMIRVLCYEENGYWLATKRLSRGRYKLWPKSAAEALKLPMKASEFKKIIRPMVDGAEHCV